MSGRGAEAERRLAELGLTGLRVEACGHEEAVAAITAPQDRWDDVLSRSEEVARAVRAAGFRFVTLDLADLPDGG